MMAMRVLVFGAVIAAMMSALPVAATIVSGTVTGGAFMVKYGDRKAYLAPASHGEFIKVDPIPANFRVGWDNFQDANVRGFDERQNFTLSKVLRVNVGKDIAAGRKISSHLIMFDAPVLMTATGTVTFSKPVLGLISSGGWLFRSDYLGNPAVTYELPRARGIEAATDAVSFLDRTVNYRFVTNSPGDSVRVITAAVPEPASWMMLIAGFGLIGAAARRRVSRRRVALVPARVEAFL
jgi:hypothetical protein